MNLLRPDELASQAEIERAEGRNRTLKRGIKTAAGIGLSAGGAALSARVLPFLNEYITSDLAIKGISKVSPQLGNFLQKGVEKGLDIKEGLNFIKDKMQEKKEPAKENRNIVEQYSPELHQFITTEVQKGRPVLEAGAIAQTNPKFKNVINQISKDHKVDWSAILKTVYGGQGQTQSQQPSQEMQSQQPQQGQTTAKLMAALQATQQARQNRR